MSRADVKEFGDIIDSGEAALVIVGETKIEAYLEKLRTQGDEARHQGTRARQGQDRRGCTGGGQIRLLTPERGDRMPDS